MFAWLVVLAGVAGAAGKDEEAASRYFRGAKGAPALESTVTRKRDGDGSVYVSVTERPAEKMTLTVRYARGDKLLSAEAVQEVGGAKKTATLTLRGKTAELTREGGETEQLTVAPDAVVTTAPDWSDIFAVASRYDRDKGGKQEFAGLCIDPVQPARQLTFTVERLGSDGVKIKDKEVSLGRYRVTLRSGAYRVWADAAGRVLKLMPEGNPAGAVFLEGYREATLGLK